MPKGVHKQFRVSKVERVLPLLVVMICNVTSHLGKWTRARFQTWRPMDLGKEDFWQHRVDIHE